MKVGNFVCLFGGFSGVIAQSEIQEDSLELLQKLIPGKDKDGTCLKQVVKELTPECKLTSVNDSQRMMFAAQLAVCEFQASNVDFPEICLGGFAAECVKKLETRPQWWTTYSGYYKLVGNLCLEYQRECELEQVVEFYINLYKAQRKVYSYLFDAMEVIDLDNVYMAKSKQIYEEMIEKYSLFNKYYQDTAGLYWSFMEKSMEKVTSLENAFDSLTLNVNSTLSSYATHFDNNLKTAIGRIGELENALRESTQWANENNNALQHTHKAIVDLSGKQSNISMGLNSSHDLANSINELLEWSMWITNSSIDSQMSLWVELESQINSIKNTTLFQIPQIFTSWHKTIYLFVFSIAISLVIYNIPGKGAAFLPCLILLILGARNQWWWPLDTYLSPVLIFFAVFPCAKSLLQMCCYYYYSSGYTFDTAGKRFELYY